MITTLRNYALISICALSAHSAMYANHNYENTALFFDLYDVVLKPTKKASLLAAFKQNYPGLLMAFKDVSNHDCADCQAYASKLKKHGYSKQAEFVNQWSAAYCINQDIIDLINAIEAKEYEVTIVSSVNEYTFDDIMPLNKRAALEVLNQEIMSVDYDNKSSLGAPNYELFEFLHILHKLIGVDAHMIYINSDQKNVKAANDYGLDGIRLKSAKQVKKDLQALGIL